MGGGNSACPQYFEIILEFKVTFLFEYIFKCYFNWIYCQCHMILQKLFECADLLLKKHFKLLSMLKTIAKYLCGNIQGCQALPAAHSSNEEGDGKNIKLIPHILSIQHQPLTKWLIAHNACLGVKEAEEWINDYTWLKNHFFVSLYVLYKERPGCDLRNAAPTSRISSHTIVNTQKYSTYSETAGPLGGGGLKSTNST